MGFQRGQSRRTHHLHDGSLGIAQGCRPGNEGKAAPGTAHLMQKRALIAMQYSALHHRTWKTPTVQKCAEPKSTRQDGLKTSDFPAGFLRHQQRSLARSACFARCDFSYCTKCLLLFIAFEAVPFFHLWHCALFSPSGQSPDDCCSSERPSVGRLRPRRGLPPLCRSLREWTPGDR